MVIFCRDLGPNDKRGYVDVIEKNDNLFVKVFDSGNEHVQVDRFYVPRHCGGLEFEVEAFTFEGRDYWLCDLVNDFIPKQFEFTDTLSQIKGHPKIPKFVTILDEFTHRYTGVRMYHIRIEYAGYMSSAPIVEYETFTDGYLSEMLLRIKGDDNE